MSERKFKPGDRVRKSPGSPCYPKFSNGDLVVTVDRYDDEDRVWLRETKTYFGERDLELAEGAPAVADKKITDYVETLQLAIEQVQNPELREDASNALTALLQTWVEPAPRKLDAAWLNAEYDRLKKDLACQVKYDFYGDDAPPAPWRPITPDYEMDKKTRDFVEVYAQGRGRNKALKHRP